MEINEKIVQDEDPVITEDKLEKGKYGGVPEDVPDATAMLQQALKLFDEQAARLEAVESAVKETTAKLAAFMVEQSTYRVNVDRNLRAENEKLREQLENRNFTPILTRLAVFYTEYRKMIRNDKFTVEDVLQLTDDLFDEINEILVNFGCEIHQPILGAMFNPHCEKALARVPTVDELMHLSIARQIRPGVVMGNIVLVPALVEVNTYKPENNN